jgi:hypothetical protein
MKEALAYFITLLFLLFGLGWFFWELNRGLSLIGGW